MVVSMLVGLSCLLCFINCSFAKQDVLNNLMFGGNYEFIDLTHPFDNYTVYWPNSRSFKFTKKIAQYVGENQKKFWYATNDFAASEHGGTHIDAPYHFFKTGKTVDEIPLEKLIVPLIIVDISSKVNDDPNYVLYKKDLDLLSNYSLEKPCLIIFKFGWTKYFHDGKKYLGEDVRKNSLNFPGLSSEVAEWITTSYTNVVGIGVDVASVDPGSNSNTPVHKILSSAGLYNLENVKLSTHVPDIGCTALVMPMKIAMGTGAPSRLVAICPK